MHRSFCLPLLAAVLMAVAAPASAQSPATTELRSAADAGNANAQYELGKHYEKGSGGLAKDMQQAAAWYEKAAAQGDMTATFNLGAMYHNGDLGKADSARAIEYWKRAGPTLGLAAVLIGDLYYRGVKVPKDETQAAYWFHKAGELGDAEGQFMLGNMYSDGLMVNKNDQKGFDWYVKAAAQGHAQAQMLLADYYNTGTLVQQDLDKAFVLYRKSAERGQRYAQLRTGIYYANGWGSAPRDLEQSEAWLAKSAAQGNAEAVRILALVRKMME